MGRKKKEQPKTTQTNTIHYTGKVNVSVEKEGKIVDTKHYHNAGTKQLYKFLCYCLAGQYKNVDADRPCRIKLFNNTQGPTPPITPALDEADEASSMVTISQQADVLPVKDKNQDNAIVNYKTVLHFVVPYALISQQRINQICLYSARNSANSDYSAIYYFVKETDGAYAWDAIELTSLDSTTYNLIIEWELSFSLDE